MLNLQLIRQRAEARAAVATPANPANWLIESPQISQLATLARVASEKQTAPQADQACTNCRHRSRAANCGEPVAAGLQDSHGIAWPEPGHGATCPAWKLNPAPAVSAVWTAAARGGWTPETVRQWLADADTEPRAVLDILTTGGPTP